MKSEYGYLKIYLAAFIWGTLGVFARLSGMPPLELSFYRLIIAALVLSVFLPRDQRLAAGGLRDYLYICAAGLLFALDCVLFFHALQLTTLSNTDFPYNLQPVFMILLSPILLRERNSQGSTRTVLIALAGLILLFIPSLLSVSLSDTIGLLYAVTGAFCLALVALIAKRLTVSAIIFVYYEIVVASLCLVPFVRNAASFPVQSYLWVGLIGLVHTAFAYILYYDGLRSVSLHYAAAIVFLAPVVASILGFLFYHEHLSIFTVTGGVLITVNGIKAVFKVKG